MDKEYIGDSVYAELQEHDGNIMLTTENGLPGDPSNTIFLEPEVLIALVAYAQKHRLVNRWLHAQEKPALEEGDYDVGAFKSHK